MSIFSIRANKIPECKTLILYAMLGTVNVASLTCRWSDENTAHITSIYTVPGFRERGYARALFEHLEERYDLHKITLVACPTDDKAVLVDDLVEIYERWGFELRDDRPRGKEIKYMQKTY